MSEQIKEEILDCNCIIEKLIEKPFSKLSSAEKLEVINSGRPTPPLPNFICKISSRNKKFKRCFQEKSYEAKPWLCGCFAVDKIFCWPCLLFSRNHERGVWTSGYSDLNHFTDASSKHVISRAHIKCCIKLKTFGTPHIDLLLNAQKDSSAAVSLHNEKVSENRLVLERLIDVVCFLGSQELAFSRNNKHDESEENKGNYVELLKLLAKYDPKLETHLNSTTEFKEISNNIENDLIYAVSSVITENINKEIENAYFVSVMLDEITDITKHSLLSVVFRYVDTNGDTKERFYQFWNAIRDRSAREISSKIINLLKSKNLGEKLIAQTYDGATVLSSELNETQSQVRIEFPHALFIHCNAHNLNLVFSQSVNFIREVNIFFVSLSSLSVFFSQSTKRSFFLHQIIKKRLPTADPIKWNYLTNLVSVVQTYLSDLIVLFEKMIDDPDTWATDAIQARGFLQFLNSFNTVFMLTTFNDVFAHTENLCSVLQTNIFNIDLCCEKIDMVRLEINNLRTQFQNIFETAKNAIYHVAKPEENLELEYRLIFFEIIDTLSLQIETRLDSVKKLKFLELLSPAKFDDYDEKFPNEAFICLKCSYGPFFDFLKLKNELCVFYNCSQLQFRNITIKDIPKMLNTLELKDTFSEILKLSLLILTIPMSNSSDECSFSAVKRTKSYARNKMLENELSELAIISIEKSFLKEIKDKNNFYDEVLKVFLKKSPQTELIYK